MRILHVIGSLAPLTGGPPRVAVRLAAAQALQEHEVAIAAYRAEEPLAVREMMGTIPGSEKLAIHELPPVRLETLLTSRAKSRLGPLVRDADVLHLHNMWEGLLRAAAAIARQHRKPYFIQPNGMLDPWAMACRATKKRVAMRLLYRQMIERSSGLVLGNRNELELLAPLDLRVPKVLAPLNAIFMEEVSDLPSPDAFHQRFPQLGGRPFVLFIGRFHHKKGVDILAEAFAICACADQRVQLVMIGVDDGAEADFRARIERHGLTPRVHMLGPQHGAVKWEAFSAATCFILPSHQEGFSIAITEALACGLPVVITTNCHFPEVAEVGAGEVVDLTVENVAAALGRVMADPERRQRMSAAARLLVQTRFSCPVMARVVVSAYQRALDGQGMSAA